MRRILVFLVCLPWPASGSSQGIPKELALSSSGRFLATITDGSTDPQHVAVIFDRRDLRTWRIEYRLGWRINHVAFSADERRILVATECFRECSDEKDRARLAEKDIGDGEWSVLWSGPYPAAYPRHVPNSQLVAFVESDQIRDESGRTTPGNDRVSILDRTGTVSPLMTRATQFSAIYDLQVATDHSLYFTAIGPRDPDLRRETLALTKPLGLWPRLAYVATAGLSGSKPSISVRHHPLSLGARREEVWGLAVSDDSRRIAYIDFADADGASNERGRRGYDIYLLEDGASRRVTNLGALQRRVSISGDGKFVAMLADPDRQRRWKIYVLEVDQARLTEINASEYRLVPGPGR